MEQKKENDKLLEKKLVEQKQKFEEENSNICLYCKKNLSTSSALSRHTKICLGKFEMIKQIEQLNNELQRSRMVVQEKEKMILGLQETLDYERTASKSTMSATNYLYVNCNDANPLKSLSGFSIFEEENEELLDLLVSYQRSDTLDQYIGNALVTYYKTMDPKDQSLWNSDAVRLTYFIRKHLVWSVDKKGVKTSNLIINPALRYFSSAIEEFLSTDPSRRNNSMTLMQDNHKRQTCLEILKNIRNGTLCNQILKYIAPYFYLDKGIKHIAPLEEVKRISDK